MIDSFVAAHPQRSLREKNYKDQGFGPKNESALEVLISACYKPEQSMFD
jgi:hypothetical protein